MFGVQVSSDGGTSAARATAGPHDVAVGQGGLNGGQLLHLAVATCVSNDLYREAARRGLTLTRVRVTADGGFAGDPAVSTGIAYDVEVAGDAAEDDLRALVAYVDAIAEVPNSLRGTTDVRLGAVTVSA